jgi:hypothetical protein
MQRQAQAHEVRFDNAHRWVLGPGGMWRLGCACFAF